MVHDAMPEVDDLFGNYSPKPPEQKVLRPQSAKRGGLLHLDSMVDKLVTSDNDFLAFGSQSPHTQERRFDELIGNKPPPKSLLNIAQLSDSGG